jgi:hypothetical protein
MPDPVLAKRQVPTQGGVVPAEDPEGVSGMRMSKLIMGELLLRQKVHQEVVSRRRWHCRKGEIRSRFGLSYA